LKKIVLLVLLAFSSLLSAADPVETILESYAPGIPLPEGDGRAVVEAACTSCHDLKGLPAYKGYWNRTRWLSMVETMVDHGASLDKAQISLVADYLVEFFGPVSP
jgi:cytochrome c5